jgi:hypothetical protein
MVNGVGLLRLFNGDKNKNGTVSIRSLRFLLVSLLNEDRSTVTVEFNALPVFSEDFSHESVSDDTFWE